jgi:hypothetical protein
MKGYPKYIATRQDFVNLLSMPEYRKQALADLQVIYDLDDEKATKTLSIKESDKKEIEPELSLKSAVIGAKIKRNDAELEVISNPMPLWKIKGFKSREDVKKLMEVKNG